jgi:hypothetical protein
LFLSQATNGKRRTVIVIHLGFFPGIKEEFNVTIERFFTAPKRKTTALDKEHEYPVDFVGKLPVLPFFP